MITVLLVTLLGAAVGWFLVRFGINVGVQIQNDRYRPVREAIAQIRDIGLSTPPPSAESLGYIADRAIKAMQTPCPECGGYH